MALNANISSDQNIPFPPLPPTPDDKHIQKTNLGPITVSENKTGLSGGLGDLNVVDRFPQETESNPPDSKEHQHFSAKRHSATKEIDTTNANESEKTEQKIEHSDVFKDAINDLQSTGATTQKPMILEIPKDIPSFEYDASATISKHQVSSESVENIQGGSKKESLSESKPPQNKLSREELKASVTRENLIDQAKIDLEWIKIIGLPIMIAKEKIEKAFVSKDDLLKSLKKQSTKLKESDAPRSMKEAKETLEKCKVPDLFNDYKKACLNGNQKVPEMYANSKLKGMSINDETKGAIIFALKQINSNAVKEKSNKKQLEILEKKQTAIKEGGVGLIVKESIKKGAVTAVLSAIVAPFASTSLAILSTPFVIVTGIMTAIDVAKLKMTGRDLRGRSPADWEELAKKSKEKPPDFGV